MMALLARIIELTERFSKNYEAYKSTNYNETRARIEFIDPFFKELGWDIENSQGFAEAYKDVIHEDAIKVEGAMKAPDYSFRIGGQRKFFLEAKKPSVNVKEDIAPAYQLRRYAWNAGLPVSILTDFEEFAIYDTTIKPNAKDKASTARIFYCTFQEYAQHWDYIASIFSKDAILKGSFDQFLKDNKKKKGTTAVDKEFLKEMEKWRNDLAKNIALRNSVSIQSLNYVVQATIDRILFLRICEDRNIEEYGRLQKLTNKTNIYEKLTEIFKQADEKYNSGLFHFRKEKENPGTPDEVSLSLKIDDKILKEIITALYYPSPYEFSVISADILGNVYEQFLGKVIRLTPAGQAKVEEKPEVKKAGGVYYTPQYIVKYIVENTVGELLKDKTPMMVAGKVKGHTPLRILDPACGSGSFLIYAYQYLLDWHRDWYTNDIKKKGTAQAKKWQDAVYQGPGKQWYLTTREKKSILINNIFGVDIDHQAVEVAKLNLLLKVLEGENQETLGTNLKLFQERALPDLSQNIKCGNSLIGSDYYTFQGKGQKDLFQVSDEERYKINAFDWDVEFPEIFKAGGFDVVIGNPPYGFHQIHDEKLKPYLKSMFVAAQGSFEHYFLFYEKSVKLLCDKGIHGFIVPVTWLTIPSGKSLRKFLLENYAIRKIQWLPALVFENAQVNTLVSIIYKKKPSVTEAKIYNELNFKGTPKYNRFSQSTFVNADFYISIFESPVESLLLKKINAESTPLRSLARPCSGYNPYEVGKGVRPEGGVHTKETVREKPYHSSKKLGADWKPEIVGRDLNRYHISISGDRWIKYGSWLAAQRDPENFKGNRLLVQEITGGQEKRIVTAYTDRELYHSRDVIPIKLEDGLVKPYVLLAILNSKLITWYHHKRNPKAQKGLFPKVLVSDLSNLPIRIPSESLSKRLVAAVTSVITLKDNAYKNQTPDEKNRLQRQIDSTDREIDRLVYELYELTDEEIKIVEGTH